MPVYCRLSHPTRAKYSCIHLSELGQCGVNKTVQAHTCPLDSPEPWSHVTGTLITDYSHRLGLGIAYGQRLNLGLTYGNKVKFMVNLWSWVSFRVT